MDPSILETLVAAIDRNTAAVEQGAATNRALLTVLCGSETEAAKLVRSIKAEAREVAKARSKAEADLAKKLEAEGTSIEAEQAKWNEAHAARLARRERKQARRTLAELTGGVRA